MEAGDRVVVSMFTHRPISYRKLPPGRPVPLVPRPLIRLRKGIPINSISFLIPGNFGLYTGEPGNLMANVNVRGVHCDGTRHSVRGVLP